VRPSKTTQVGQGRMGHQTRLNIWQQPLHFRRQRTRIYGQIKHPGHQYSSN
jgi:hypothetical protein